MGTYDESTLVQQAQEILGTDADIRAAGIFGLADLSLAYAAGLAGGGAAADVADVADALGGGVVGSFADALTAVAGGRAAVTAAAAASGATVQLIVAVTPDAIHVLNRDTGGRLAAEYASFPRDETEATVSSMGASRYLTLSYAGHRLRLHGTTSWLSPLAKGDKLVMALLAAHD